MVGTKVQKRFLLMRSLLATIVCSGLSGAILACSNDGTGPRSGDVSHLLSELEVNASAITLSTVVPYNTFQLQIVPKTLTGATLSESPTIRFVVGDGQDTTVFVNSTGLLTAHAPTQGVQVKILVTVGKVTRTEFVLVKVTAAPPASPTHPLRTFSIHPPLADSYSINCSLSSYSSPITPTLVDADGNVMDNPAVFYRAPDSTVLNVDRFSGTVTPKCFGAQFPVSGWVVATATVYGVEYVDSVLVTLNVPLAANVLVLSVGTPANPMIMFNPSDMIIAQGGIVVWGWFCISEAACSDQLLTDVVFDHPELVAAIPDSLLDPGGSGTVYPPSDGGGDIPAWFGDTFTPDYFKNMRLRRFPTPGVIHFHSSQFPTVKGTITVVPSP